MFAELFLFHLLLCSLSFPLLMHSDTYIFFNLPQQHTIHVVVSCIFHNLSSFFFAVVLSSARSCFSYNLKQNELTDHMNVSSAE